MLLKAGLKPQQQVSGLASPPPEWLRVHHYDPDKPRPPAGKITWSRDQVLE